LIAMDLADECVKIVEVEAFRSHCLPSLRPQRCAATSFWHLKLLAVIDSDLFWKLFCGKSCIATQNLKSDMQG
jgi:hypothetical protein